MKLYLKHVAKRYITLQVGYDLLEGAMLLARMNSSRTK